MDIEKIQGIVEYVGRRVNQFFLGEREVIRNWDMQCAFDDYSTYFVYTARHRALDFDLLEEELEPCIFNMVRGINDKTAHRGDDFKTVRIRNIDDDTVWSVYDEGSISIYGEKHYDMQTMRTYIMFRVGIVA